MFSHILAPLDGSPLAVCVLPHVVAVARPPAHGYLTARARTGAMIWLGMSTHSTGKCRN
jgi:hypothetical protein